MDKESLKIFVFTSLISADNDAYAEEVKQEILCRYNKDRDNPDWKWVLEPLGEDADKYVQLLKD